MKNLGPLGSGYAEYDAMEPEDDMYISDDFDWSEPSGGAVDLFEDDDGPCDEPEVQNGPYCPMDALDALEHCGRLAYMIASGGTVSPEEAARAAGRAVKCFTCYEYEQQPWFTEALPFMKKREPRNVPTDERLIEPRADVGSGDKCDRVETTGA